MIKTLISCIALLSVAAPAAAANWTFSFTVADGGILSGNIGGTLQGDNNTVLVDSVSNAMFNGVPGVATGFVSSYAAYFGGAASPAFVTLDGAGMDLLACDSAACLDGIVFVTNNEGFGGTSAALSGISYGLFYDEYESANWSMDASTGAVPEPASWAMLIAGFGLTGAAMRRRRVAVVSA